MAGVHMLNNASNVSITESNFHIVGAAYYANGSSLDPGSRGIDLLLEHIAPGAFHNSKERHDPPKCHPQTRLAILKAIMAWIDIDIDIDDGQRTSSDSSLIMWLYGSAGAGKSAIAQTIAEICYRRGLLAASFFWSRTQSTSANGRNDEERLITTLAYQLISAIPEMRSHVENALQCDPLLIHRSLEAQMESLLVKPLEKVFLLRQNSGSAERIKPKLIILDGLDECGTPKSQRYIIDVISSAVRSFSIPLIFLIASRPEQEIREGFNSKPVLSVTRRLALDDTYRPNDDIRLFLSENFDALKKSPVFRSSLPQAWPTTEDIDTLVDKASGQFIYAATVVKFVSSRHHRPDEQLDIIIGISNPEIHNHTPFAELDTLYHHIFSSVKDFHLPRALEIIGHFISGWSTPNLIEELFSYKRGDVAIILSDLHSVLRVPDPNDSEDSGMVYPFHASLLDFLTDPHRSGKFYMDKGKIQARAAQHCLRHLSHPAAHNTDNFEEYASNYLVPHTSEAYPTKGLLEDFFNFDIMKWVSQSLANAKADPEFSDEMKRKMASANSDLNIDPKVRAEINEMKARVNGAQLRSYSFMFKLSAWFRKQEPIVKEFFGPEMDLHAHHSGSLDVIISQMVQEYFESELGKNKITALTHPSFAHVKDSSVILDVLAFPGPLSWDYIERNGACRQLLQVIECHCYGLKLRINSSDPSLIASDYSASCGYENQVPEGIYELQEFLCDQNRSGMYFVTGAMYASLSSQIVRFIFGQSKQKQEVSMRWALESLPFYLSKADYAWELVAYLLHYTMGVAEGSYLFYHPQQFQDAIDEYLERVVHSLATSCRKSTEATPERASQW